MNSLEKYRTILQSGSNELIIKKSRFIATFSRVGNEVDAQEFVQRVKKLHKAANHNCSAYVIGENDEIARAHDDGEPSGTAGVPMLEALKLMQLKNVAVVVTRYFGGIKLGTGGLIRAYSGAVSDGAKAIGIVVRSIQSSLVFASPYNLQGSIDYFLNEHEITIAHQDYGVDVSYEIYVDPTELEFVKNGLTEIMHGQVDFTEGKPRYVEQLVEQNKDLNKEWNNKKHKNKR